MPLSTSQAGVREGGLTASSWVRVRPGGRGIHHLSLFRREDEADGLVKSLKHGGRRAILNSSNSESD